MGQLNVTFTSTASKTHTSVLLGKQVQTIITSPEAQLATERVSTIADKWPRLELYTCIRAH